MRFNNSVYAPNGITRYNVVIHKKNIIFFSDFDE